MRKALAGCGAALGVLATLLAHSAQRGSAPVDVIVGVATSFGLPIDDLPPQAFSAAVDGRPIVIDAVRQTRAPLTVALLIDVSGSMNTLRWVDLRRGKIQLPTLSEQMLSEVVVDGFRDALLPADRARLSGISASPWIGPVVAHTREAFEATLEDLLAHRRDPSNVTRSSPVWDAAGTLVDLLRSEPQRRLVVIVTDGKVNANLLSPEKLAERAVEARVAIAVVDESQAILMRQDRAPTAAVRPDRALRWVAEATGGAYLADSVLRGAPEPADPAGLVSRAIEGHRHAYTLTLTVPDDGRPHTLEVSVTRPDAAVRAPAFIHR